MIAQLTRALFNTIDSSFDEPSTPAIHLTTADNPALDNGDVSSDDEPNDIPNIILPTTPRPRSSPHAELVTSGHPRQRMQLDGKEALVELHPLMDDVENDLFIPLNLEHLNSALAVPPRGICGPAAPSPFPLNPSQRPGIQRKISQPFAEHDVGGEPPRQTEPTDKSPIESNDLPSQTARARLLEEDREGEVSRTNGALMVEEIRRETACATVEHACVTATEEEDSKQWPGKAHDMTPSAPVQTMAGGRDMENGSVPRESEPREATMDPTEQAVLSQPPKNPGPSGDDDIDEPSADSAGEATENLLRLATRPLPEWIHSMETWNNRLIDDPLSVAMRYESDTCSRLGRQMLCLAKVCKAIPRRPGTRKQFNYFGDTDSNDKSLVPKYIEGVDNHVEEVTMKMLGTDSSTPAKSRRQVAMDIRRNIIPLAIYTVELVFLAGASAVGVGRLNAIPEHAEHTSQTLQLLRRVLVWVGRLERAAAEEFASASNRQQDMGPDASPLMLDRHGLDVMIQKLQKAVGDSYTALNKQIDKVNRPIIRQESHSDELAEANLQNTQRGESRQAKRKRKDDEKQAAREEAKRRCIESVIRFTEGPTRDTRRPAHRSVAKLLAKRGGSNEHYHPLEVPQRVPTAPGTSGRAYPDEVFKRVLRALKYSQKPDVETIAESMKYHVEDVWDVIALLKRAAEAQQRAGGSRMPEGLRRSFEHLYRR
ncbi:hypothetical protein D7B24_008992 [Verticillium nonalfalfae]|uniref:Uncharacterized protein n=1 Tax=Verticillium nonalfalfae TaxID=1051616 RepID=A0A3M9Y4L7_9PEZI|nr:uncharacterized protein D7B24_008992 [Verticillium nonalfalfae]RNJ55125.1 hypothetical protein D7B24_008992 [Verticillium nonalfalfae]